MRLLTRKIHRAFPELDSYGDEQCDRFIRSARSSPLVVVLHTVAILGTMLPLLMLGLLGALKLSDRWMVFAFADLSDIFTLRMLKWLSTGGLMLLAGPIAGYVVRDLLLRQRLRYVLRKRGGCPGCGYSVIGLRVERHESGASIVRCPECGVQVEVDASLAELEKGEGASARAVGAVGETGRVFAEGKRVDLYSFWTPDRTRRIKRAAIISAIVVFGGGGLVAGINELLTQRAASAARRDFAAASAEFRAMSEKLHADLGGSVVLYATSGSNAWPLFEDADAMITEADEKGWLSRVRSGDPRAVQPEFSFLERPDLLDNPNQPAWLNRSHRVSAELAARMIAAYRAAGVFDTLTRAGAAASTFRPETDFISGPFSGNVDTLRMLMIQRLIRVNAARAALAAQAGDRKEFLASIGTFLTLARACASQPTSVQWELAYASEWSANAAIRRWMFSAKADPAWLPEIEAMLKKDRVTPRPDLAFKGDQLLTRCTVDLFFSEPDRFRFGRFSDDCQSLFRGIAGQNSPTRPDLRLGTYAENIRELEAHGTTFAPLFTMEAFARPALPAMPTDSPAFASLGLMRLWCLPPAFMQIDDWAADRRGIDLWLAIERSRVQSGAYPNTLDELVPRWIAAVPVDPWSGKPPLYTRVDHRVDPHGRAFILYFVGPGGLDDGGSGIGPGLPASTWSLDIVVNDPRR